MKKIKILHVFPDEKFFDDTSIVYDNQEGITNLYYFYTPDNEYQFKYIHFTNKVYVINDKQKYLSLFSNKDIDAILFHSLRIYYTDYFKYIDKQKIVIWWSWGGDIYNNIFSDVKPLITWELYKPITKKYIEDSNASAQHQKISVMQLLRQIKHKYTLRRVVRRIDFFLPCLPIDYKILKEQCKFFYAEIFPQPRLFRGFPFIYHQKSKNILIGNSFTFTNNHLDIFEKLSGISLNSDQKFLIPVNYGWGNAFGNNPDNLIALSKLKPNSTIWLKDYIERSKYFELFGNVTHAIFGVLRQQALGNIYHCLRSGIKVYLYKDSLVAKQLKEDGYIIFTIEDDLTKQSLSECLNYDDALHNYQLMINFGKENTSQFLIFDKLNEFKKNR